MENSSEIIDAIEKAFHDLVVFSSKLVISSSKLVNHAHHPEIQDRVSPGELSSIPTDPPSPSIFLYQSNSSLKRLHQLGKFRNILIN